jgi:hypothetical protein
VRAFDADISTHLKCTLNTLLLCNCMHAILEQFYASRQPDTAAAPSNSRKHRRSDNTDTNQPASSSSAYTNDSDVHNNNVHNSNVHNSNVHNRSAHNRKADSCNDVYSSNNNDNDGNSSDANSDSDSDNGSDSDCSSEGGALPDMFYCMEATAGKQFGHEVLLPVRVFSKLHYY